MGHIKKKRPRRGSLQFWPRKRARRIFPAIKNWAKKKEPKLLGFAGYKVGMSAVRIIDNRPKSPTKGEELRKAVTVIEVPPMKIVGVRIYSKSPYGLKCIGEVWTDKLDKELKRLLTLPKKPKSTLDELKEKLGQAAEVRVLVHTLPKLAGFGKKKPELMEIAIGGDDPKQKFDYASSLLGKEIRISDVFKEGEFLDVHAVTKGKGFQGVIKRFGIKLERHKAEKGQRKLATMGPWTPKIVPWWTAQAERMGYRTRTEYNKQLLKIASPKEQPVNPKSGFIRYGKVKSDYILLAGSVPGPKKRLIRLSHAIRPTSTFIQPPEIIEISLRSQQG